VGGRVLPGAETESRVGRPTGMWGGRATHGAVAGTAAEEPEAAGCTDARELPRLACRVTQCGALGVVFSLLVLDGKKVVVFLSKALF
jgi:hypothetical protein